MLPRRSAIPGHARSPALRAALALGLAAGLPLAVAALGGGLGILAWRVLRAGVPLAALPLALGAVACLAIAAAGALARSPRFEPPGPRLVPEDQPALFALLGEVAGELGCAVPRRVFLSPEVNAATARTGPGGEPVLALGLGLFSVESVGELRATLAHELAHLDAGDARLDALARRVREELEPLAGPPRPAGRFPLGWAVRVHARLVLRATRRLARDQELRADDAAIRLAGPRTFSAGLEREVRGAVLYRAFLEEEVSPLGARGFRPENLYDGFRAYAEELAAQGRSTALGEALGAAEAGPDDSHPALAERLARARAAPAEDAERIEGRRAGDDRPARSLLANAERLERELTEKVARGLASGRRLDVVRWSDVAARVWGPRVAAEGALYASRISAGYGGASTAVEALRAVLPTLRRGHDEAAALVLEPELAAVPVTERTGHVASIVSRALGALVAAALVEQGAAWRCEVGRPIEVVLDAMVVAPFELAAEALGDRDRLPALLRVAADLA